FGSAGELDTVGRVLDRGHSERRMARREGLGQKAPGRILRVQKLGDVKVIQKCIQVYTDTPLMGREIGRTEILKDVVRHHFEQAVARREIERAARDVGAVDEVAIVIGRRRQRAPGSRRIALSPLIWKRVFRIREVLELLERRVAVGKNARLVNQKDSRKDEESNCCDPYRNCFT